MWKLSEITKSFGEYTWGGIVGTVVLSSTLISIALACVLAAFDINGIPRWVALALIVVALIVAPFIAFHRVRLNRDKALDVQANYEDLKPTIRVCPHYEGSCAWIVVHNDNSHHEAKFTVKVSGLGPTSKGPQNFKARWRHGANDRETYVIKAKDSNEADLIKTEGSNVDGTIGVSIYDAYHTPPDVRITMGATIKMQIEVLTEPSAKEFFVQEYVLQLGAGGNWNRFEEL